MRIDYQSAISALTRALEMLKAPAPSTGDLLARLYDLTTILFENELCAAALDAVVGERADYEANLERCRRLTVERIGPSLLAFFQELRGVRNAIQAHPNQDRAAGSMKVVNEHLEAVFRGDVLHGAESPRTHAQLFGELSDETSVLALDVSTLLELHKIREAGGHFRQRLDQAARQLDAVPHAQLTALTQSESDLESEIGKLVQSLRFAEELLRSASLQPLVDQLWELHTEMGELLDGTGPYPLDRGSALLRASWLSSFAHLIGSADRIVSLVEYRLHAGSVEYHALVRLQTFLENFGRDELQADFDREEREHPTRRQFEAKLQRHVDRFLFGEGLFPITHAEASGGPIDTFVEASEHLFSEVGRTHQRPVLLELKVQVRSDTTEADVRAKAVRAIEQATIYSRHLRAKPSWRAHTVTALVAYDGPRRYSTDRDDLMLVYLGDASPSQGSKVLEIDLS